MNDFLKETNLLLNTIELNTAEHWKNYYKDVPIECIYDDLVIDINEIKRLKDENMKLGIKLEDKAYEELKVGYQTLKEENKKYKQVIDKLGNLIKKEYEYSKKDCVPARKIICEKILDNLKEVE